MHDYIIRPAQQQTDHQALCVLARVAVDEAQGLFASRRVGSELPTSAFDSSVVLVAETTAGKRLVGFVSIRFTEIAEAMQSHGMRRADITMLGVAPDMRRMGIGRELMLHALKQAKGWGATLITLCVAEQNRAAISLYESMGWLAVDRMMVFPTTARSTS
jgi:ribosomal protein S18 acetylase RimI-like enzyme